ncbi:MAG TPA: hypothetical protein VHS31_18800 [Tepidisphaeraceae bacterium]|jgi:hypothetical protein|nr:hypothetical protein [Tepidisphaeraceae bacterium]
MMNWIRHLDQLLRGETTRIEQLRAEKFDVPIVGLAVMIDLLGLIYGACMGAFAITGSGSGHLMQIPATMLKVPALFLLTLVVTMPSLYVFNALVGSRLSFVAVLRLLISAMAVTLAVLASIGPIVAFFSVCTTSYHFMVVLNTFVFALAGALGLAFLLQTLHRMTIAEHFGSSMPVPTASELSVDETNPEANTSGPLQAVDGYVLGPHVKTVFHIWVMVFGLVGSQMGWLLRPFIGAPDQAFTWFRPRTGNFFQAVLDAIWHLVK